MDEQRCADWAASEGELFRLLVENVVDYAIFVMDPEGLVRTWSHGAERLLGYREDEILGRKSDVFFTPEDVRDDIPRLEMQQALDTGRGDDDRWHVRKDGTRFWVSGVMTPLRDEAGRFRGFAKIMRDRTEWWHAEQARLEGEGRFRTAFAQASVGMAVMDAGGRFLEANPAYCEITGYTSDELLQRDFASITHPDDLPKKRESIRRMLDGGVPGFVIEKRYVRKDGGIVWVKNSVSLVRDGEGRPLRIIALTEDITQRKGAEEGLREQTRIAEALNRIGVLVAAELDLDRLVQVVTDEATRLTDARFGAFFYNVPDGRGGAYTLYTISGVPREAFSRFPMPRATDLFGPTFRNEGAVRIDDVTQDPRFGKNAPYHGMPEGHLPVRSYLAVSVVSRTGEVLGGLFFGHPEPGVFAEADERLVVGIAAQAAVAIDNARLYRDLKESERRFRHLADAMPQLVWVTRPDRSVEYVNRRWLDYTGQTQDECLGPAGWAAVIHPDDLGRVADASVRAHAGKEPFEAEYRIRDASGAYRWHLGRSVPVFDESGLFVRRFGAATDIDDRKRAERDAHFLADASAGLASIVDEASTLQRVAGLAVPHFADWCSVDLADEGVQLRRLALAHFDREKVGLAHDLHRRFPPDPDAPYGVPHVIRTGSPEMVAEITDDLIVAGARDEEHLRILRELGLKSYICVPLKGRIRTLGAITFVAAESGRRYGPQDLRLAEDLASRAAIAVENSRLYSELKEADRRKNDFLATLAHELRNPLSPIRNALQLMKGPGGGEGFEAERAMAERNVFHLARLIDDLMDIARINRGKIELSKQVVDLATVVKQAVETARPLIDERRHELSVAMPEGAIRVEADPTRLEQVFWNLLNNSAKYTGPGGQIRLSAERDGGEAVVRVRDSGIGIRPEMLPKVFDMFVQVGEHRDHAQGGLGIGLSLVKTLVEMHGGSITANSEGPGRGSEFVVRLPLLVGGQPSGARDGDLRRATDAKPPRRRILVVDDNVDAAKSLSRLLERLYGQEVRVAHDGPEALAVAEDFRPEVVLLDIGLPGMDGNEVARRLRGRPEFEKTLIVALTGWGQESDLARSREAGFDHHLVKPANPDAIRDLLDHFRASSTA